MMRKALIFAVLVFLVTALMAGCIFPRYPAYPEQDYPNDRYDDENRYDDDSGRDNDDWDDDDSHGDEDDWDDDGGWDDDEGDEPCPPNDDDDDDEPCPPDDDNGGDWGDDNDEPCPPNDDDPDDDNGGDNDDQNNNGDNDGDDNDGGNDDPPPADQYEFNMESVHGYNVSSKDYLGAPLCIWFWWTKCGYSLGMLNDIDHLSQISPTQYGFWIVGAVAPGGNELEKDAFIQRYFANNLKMEMVMDMDHQFQNDAGTGSVPLFIFINSEGEWVDMDTGAMTNDQIIARMQKVMNGN